LQGVDSRRVKRDTALQTRSVPTGRAYVGVQAKAGRRRQLAPGVQTYALPLGRALADDHPPPLLETRRPRHPLDLVLLEEARHPLREPAHHLVLARHHRGQAERPAARPDAVGGQADLRLAVELARVEQGLRRDAADVATRSA